MHPFHPLYLLPSPMPPPIGGQDWVELRGSGSQEAKPQGVPTAEGVGAAQAKEEWDCAHLKVQHFALMDLGSQVKSTPGTLDSYDCPVCKPRLWESANQAPPTCPWGLKGALWVSEECAGTDAHHIQATRISSKFGPGGLSNPTSPPLPCSWSRSTNLLSWTCFGLLKYSSNYC